MKEQALAIAKGCFDYAGGYSNPVEREIFHHGIQTVVNELQWWIDSPDSVQVRMLGEMGREKGGEPIG